MQIYKQYKNVKLYVGKNVDEIAETVANKIIALVRSKPRCSLGLSANKALLPIYKKLIEDYQQNRTNYKRVKTFNSSELLNLNQDYRSSCAYFMANNFFNLMKLKRLHIYFPITIKQDNEFSRYDRIVSSLNGLDIQLITLTKIQADGYDPTDIAQSTHLSERKIYNFDLKKIVPGVVIITGLRIMQNSKHLILIATKKSDAEFIKKLFSTRYQASNPYRMLSNHRNFSIYTTRSVYRLVNK